VELVHPKFALPPETVPRESIGVRFEEKHAESFKKKSQTFTVSMILRPRRHDTIDDINAAKI